MRDNGKFGIYVSFYIVLSTFLFGSSSSKTLVCEEPHVPVQMSKGLKRTNVTNLKISISFESEQFRTTSQDYATLHINDTEVIVQASIVTKKSNGKLDSMKWNSTQSDGADESKRTSANAYAKYHVYDGSNVTLGQCQTWLANPNYTVLDANRLMKENKDYGKRSKFIYEAIMAEIRNCVKEKVCAELKERVEEQYLQKNQEQTKFGIIEDDTKESMEEDDSESEETSEEGVETSEEGVEEVDKKRANASIHEKLNGEESENPHMGHIISLPAISRPYYAFKNGSLGELQRIKIQDEMKVTDLDREIRITIPMELPTAIAHYEYEYLKPSSIEYPKEIIVYAENMEFEVDVLARKIGEKCESSIEKLKTVYPGKITNVIDKSTEESVTYPITELIKNAWKEEMIFVIENELYEVVSEKLREIEC